MGKKKTRTEQTNKPVYEAEIKGAANNLTDTYNTQRPAIQGYANMIGELAPGLIDKVRNGDSTVNAARGFVENTLGSDPQNNPYLDDMVGLTNDNTRRSIQTSLGTRGGIGGSAERDIVSRALSEQELGMRYSDYDQQMQRKMQAAGMAPSLVGADNQNLGAAMSAAEFGAMLPLNAASQYAGTTGGLLGQYQNQTGTQTSKPGFTDYLGLGLQAASLFSDERLKENINRVGQTDAGLPIYTYTMKGDSTPLMGVMAQEVEAIQPDALGPEVGGFKTVKYGNIR